MAGAMMASDANNPQFLGAYNPDAALVVKFYSKAVHQPFPSIAAGRPIYENVDYIQIFTPGNQLNIIDTPVRPEHKQRFRAQWADYEAGRGSGMEKGTPLTQWPAISAAQAEEFRGVKFFTVEQLAMASDLQLQSLGMIGGMNPSVIRDRAKAFLSLAAGNAPTEQLAQENAEMKQRLADMEKQLAALAAGKPVMAEEKPKRKRRTKAEMEADNAVSNTPPPASEPVLEI